MESGVLFIAYEKHGLQRIYTLFINVGHFILSYKNCLGQALDAHIFTEIKKSRACSTQTLPLTFL